MSCYKYLCELLNNEKIELVSSLPLLECKILRPYKLTNAGFEDFEKCTVYMMAVPYKYFDDCEKNISDYAISRDYHLFYKNLFCKITNALKEKYSGYRFCGFADSSPIDEVHAAAYSGVGIHGLNHMLITEKYSSFVFLGEIITDYPEEIFTVTNIKECEGCKACMRACPMMKHGVCLSSLTQKKGNLTEEEKNIIKEYGSVWGCDICINACPHTKKAIDSGNIYTDIDFFKSDRTPYLTYDLIKNMSDEEFNMRAYSWRKKETILRNLDIIYGGEK